jgi:hypothetical protein
MAAQPTHRLWAALVTHLLTVALLAGCGPTFDAPPPTRPGAGGPPPLPSSAGALYGRVLTADGLAATRSTVNLVQIRPGDTLFAVFSLGFGCLLPNACANRSSARVSSEGAYTFPAQAVQPDLRSVVTATLTPLDDQWTGPQTSAGLTDAADPQEVPDLVAWEPELTVAATGTDLRVRWAPLSIGGLSGPDVTYTLDAVLGETGSPLVRVAAPSRSTEAAIDARQFEDGRYHFVVSAETKVAIDGRDVEFAYRSGSHPAPAKTGAPPSRGRPCLTDDPAGVLQTVEPCPLTDGDLDRHEQVSYPACTEGAPGCVQTHQRVCIDLGTPRPVGLVVYRTPFLYDKPLVELSTDGRRFVAAGRPETGGRGNTEVFSVRVEPAKTAKVVCLRHQFSGAALREISVW